MSGWGGAVEDEGGGCDGGESREKRDGEGAIKERYWSRTWADQRHVSDVDRRIGLINGLAV